MNLLSIALVMLTLVPQDQNLPDEFYKLPEQDRAKATLIVTGTYGQGRSPCMFMPDGTRRWTLLTWFQIKKVYRGQVGGKSIQIKWKGSPKTEDDGVKLEVGREYLVVLRPSEESMKAIRAGEYVSVWDALDTDEIIAIVALKKDEG